MVAKAGSWRMISFQKIRIGSVQESRGLLYLVTALMARPNRTERVTVLSYPRS